MKYCRQALLTSMCLTSIGVVGNGYRRFSFLTVRPVHVSRQKFSENRKKIERWTSAAKTSHGGFRVYASHLRRFHQNWSLLPEIVLLQVLLARSLKNCCFSFSLLTKLQATMNYGTKKINSLFTPYVIMPISALLFNFPRVIFLRVVVRFRGKLCWKFQILVSSYNLLIQAASIRDFVYFQVISR